MAGDGGDFGEVDLVAQLGLGLVLVDGEVVGAQDEVDGFPLLGMVVLVVVVVNVVEDVVVVVVAVLGVTTFVLRVRLSTVPALMMRSNSKQPCWFTGDMRAVAGAAAAARCGLWRAVLSVMGGSMVVEGGWMGGGTAVGAAMAGACSGGGAVGAVVEVVVYLVVSEVVSVVVVVVVGR